MTSRSETQLSRDIQDTLKGCGFWVVRSATYSGRVKGGFLRTLEPGFPDLMILSPVVGFLEVKRPGEKRRDEQIAWHERAKKAGLNVATIESGRDAVQAVRGWAG